MLVLSRKSGEKIHIGDDIVVEIKRVTGTRVTIAIQAPRDLRILRGELLEAANEFVFETGTTGPEQPEASAVAADETENEPQLVKPQIPMSIPTDEAFLNASQRLTGVDFGGSALG
ncbi:carbon storage regulator [Adhaeretor mobilis]|uniref:Translational regulator CsrA n=1 Tax=Adhaeretor mobilis TaxID=1930276 RepID=A0A517MY66_9BACT|nr:carbon storage regulator [Adhaeretor mobilis]QDS99822.1 hypothetical protein HG15A2_31530 [Adhaeretor mobilis]